jgi:GNAT superfamily N-acetyltransferase
MPDAGADPALVSAWLTARSIARGLPLPAPDHGGLRVDTGAPDESRRYVFARPCAGLQALGHSIDDPRTVLKLCASPEEMRDLLPARWSLKQSGALMISDRPMPVRPAPEGYRLVLYQTGQIWRCAIESVEGVPAASGYAVEHGGVFIFDRIAAEPAHQRRGLGSALVTALASARRHGTSRYVLVATAAGRALYETLGWTALAPYTTARLVERGA